MICVSRAEGDNGVDLPGMDAAAYGNLLGADYDTLYPATGLETDAAVDFLAEVATRQASPALLELGIGTGRLALPLSRRGVRVAGIEASPRMLRALHDKDPDNVIDVTLGDFAEKQVDGQFSVVALVFNTVLDERGLPVQLAIFQNAARHLAPAGCFVVEAFVLPDEARDGNWQVSPRYVGGNHVELQMARFDLETNTVERTLVHLRPDGAKFVTVRDAYAAPGELDVMAHVAGMKRIERYCNWRRDPFTISSRRHISVYQVR